MPQQYRDRFGSARGPYPPNDHLHAANAHFLPPGAFAKVGREGWIDFMEDVGLASAVLYPTNGLSFGRVVSLDWAIELAHAYNDWMHDEYLSKSYRFQALGLIPLQEPAEAVKELRRIVKELGFCGAMLPSTGVIGAQNHLGDEKYWPIYEEANRLECCIGIHGGVHDHMGLDDMTPYAPVNALGHPFGQMVNFAGILFNGVFDKYPKVRFGFMEAGAGWFVNCIERFERSWNSHVQYDPRGRFLKLRDKRIDHRLHQAPRRRRSHLRRRRGRRAHLALRSQRRRQQAVYLLLGFSARSEQRHVQSRARRIGRKQAAHPSGQRRGALSQRRTLLRFNPKLDTTLLPRGAGPFLSKSGRAPRLPPFIKIGSRDNFAVTSPSPASSSNTFLMVTA